MAKKKKPKAEKPERQGKGLTAKPTPDVSRKVLARDDSPVRVGLRDLNHAGLVKAAKVQETGEQLAVRKASKAAVSAMEDADVRAAVSSMVTFRRGYAVVYRALQEALAAERGRAEAEGKSLCVEVEDMLVQSAMFESSKPFDEHQFMNGMIGVTMPYIADVIDRHTKEEDDVRREDALAAEEERVQKDLPIGFHHTPQQEAPTLDRKKTLVLAGPRKALLWLAAQAEAVLAEPSDGRPHTVVRFADTAPRSRDQGRHAIRLAGNLWEGCGDSQKKMALCMGQYVADRLPAPPDVLIVDDLSRAYTLGFVGRPAAASAGDAHKQLRKWCDRAGCGLMAMLPHDPGDDEQDLTAPEWEQLRIFTNLRPVTLSAAESPDHLRITVGNGATVFDVSKAELDAYCTGGIVLPAGVGT